MFGFGHTELLIVVAVMLLLFGSAKLPSLMRNMGRSVNEFKAGMKDKPAGAGNIDDKSDDA
ncbi:MAG: twin-arginine translocase TatA/TatE family subunit [Pirellulaceae bacterium]|jgi:sec-independent protein translocase protein TatA|nr:twin-arginine translocase TatA/TatE family subunit [Pirellulaceae bacterium]